MILLQIGGNILETWKAIKGYEGIYEVSDCGKVRSLDRTVFSKKWKRGRIQKGRELYENVLNDGYVQVALCKDSHVEYKKVHRLVANAFIPNPENKPEINHKNGNKADNNVSNLEWVTKSENMKHAYRNLKVPPNKPLLGKPSQKRKLTREQVDAILKDVRSQVIIANEYGVCQQTISNIKTGLYYSVW